MYKYQESDRLFCGYHKILFCAMNFEILRK